MIARLLSDVGEGLPLVYVPGIDATGEMLLGTADRLEQAFRLVRIRYEPDGEDTYPFLAQSVDDVVANLGLDRVLVLCESFGGGVALQWALDHPERVAGVLIVNSFAYHSWRVRLQLACWVAPLLRGPIFRVARRFASPQALFGNRNSPELRESFQHVGGGQGMDDAYCRRLRMIQGLDLRPRLPELTQPLAIVASDSDRIVPSLAAAHVMHELAPNTTLELLPGAGHIVLPLEDEPWFLLAPFLPRCLRYIEGGSCLVHCVSGKSRSVAIALSFLMVREGMRFKARGRLRFFILWSSPLEHLHSIPDGNTAGRHLGDVTTLERSILLMTVM